MSRLTTAMDHLTAARELIAAELATAPAAPPYPLPVEPIAPPLEAPPLGGVVASPTVPQDVPVDTLPPVAPPVITIEPAPPIDLATPIAVEPPADVVAPIAPIALEPAAPAALEPIATPTAPEPPPVAAPQPIASPLILPTDPTAERRAQLRRDVGVIEQRLLEQVGIGLGSADDSMQTAARNWQGSVTAAAAALYAKIDQADAAALEAINPNAGWPQ